MVSERYIKNLWVISPGVRDVAITNIKKMYSVGKNIFSFFEIILKFRIIKRAARFKKYSIVFAIEVSGPKL